MIHSYTPNTNNEVVDNTQESNLERVDIPTQEEEQALLAYEEHFRQDELASFHQNARDNAMNRALSEGFVIDESSDGQERWAHLSA